MGIGVAIAVKVADFINGHSTHGKVDILPFTRVEAAQKYLLSVTIAPKADTQRRRALGR